MSTTSTRNPPARSKAVLLVDDDRDSRGMLKEFLVFSGLDVATAEDGLEALAMIEYDPPTIILMDLSMPRMDGWETTRRVKADPQARDTVVVAVSAYALTSEVARAFEAGCDGFIAKPVDLAVVFETVQGVLERGLDGLPKSVRRPATA